MSFVEQLGDEETFEKVAATGTPRLWRFLAPRSVTLGQHDAKVMDDLVIEPTSWTERLDGRSLDRVGSQLRHNFCGMAGPVQGVLDRLSFVVGERSQHLRLRSCRFHLLLFHSIP